MSDTEIVKKILTGDQGALRDFILKYQDLVVNTCYRILHNRSDAEDITQEVFIEAYRSMASLRQEETVSYWLYRVSLNKSINFSRKHRLFNTFLRFETMDQGNGERIENLNNLESDDPHEQLEHTEKLQMIEAALDSLPARQKKAFVLHHYEYLSYKDISTILKVSVSSVESLIFRAKTTIKKRCARCGSIDGID